MSDLNSKNTLQQKLKDVLYLLKDISNSIKSFKEQNNEFEIREQLKGISNTISTFENKKLSVPAELRNLRASLISKLSGIEETNKLVLEYQNEIRILFNIRDTQKPKEITKSIGYKFRSKKNYPTISLSELVSVGLIEPNTKIVHRGRITNYSGIIMKNGTILCNIRGANKFFDTPSGAAEALSGGSKNGWDWWFVEQGGKDLPLSKFRDNYINNNK